VQSQLDISDFAQRSFELAHYRSAERTPLMHEIHADGIGL